MTAAPSPNVFNLWVDLLRLLHRDFLAEVNLMPQAALLDPQAGELMGSLAQLINDCLYSAEMLDRMQANAPEQYAAFMRAARKAAAS